MAKILGLDLGTNSIGWAIVDDKNSKILDTGVRIFPEGVVAKTIGSGDKEESKNAKRRESRQTRRGFYRKRLRKIKLLRTLINFKMCPLEHFELDVWSKWDKIKKKEGRMAPELFLPENSAYNLWLKQNPYILRDKALSKDLTLTEFGRVLYHLIQRRGFLSNRKGKDDGKIYGGKEGIVGIDKTNEQIKNSTLGKFLFKILPKEGEPFKIIEDELGNELRVRSRYTLRDMYIAEFEAIWNRQAKHLGLDNIYYSNVKNVLLKGSLKNKKNERKINHLKKIKGNGNIEIITLNNNLSKNEKPKYLLKIATKLPLKEFLAGRIEKDEDGKIKFKSNESVLFWQRPLRSQKKLLAKCRFEPDLKDDNGKFIQKGKTPCHLSHPLYEEYRAYQYVNNIEYGKKQRLEESQRKQVIDLINSKDGNFKFSEIKKKLKLSYETFNYSDDSSVNGNYMIKNLNSIFPKEILEKEFVVNVNKEDIIEYGYERIWHLFHFCEDNDVLIKKLQDNFDLSENDIEKISKINLKEGYSNVSLKAIKNILPYLKEGKLLSDAVILGGVRNVFGKKWHEFIDFHEKIEKDILYINHQKSNKEGEAIEKIKKYLIDYKFGFTENDNRFKKLYHHSQDVVEVKLQKKIGPVEDLRNPIVQQGVNEVRRLVNELLDVHGKFDQVRVELGRDLKNNKSKREEIGYKIRENTAKNEKAKELLIEYGLRQSRDNVQKVLLFQEMLDRGTVAVCPYTNKTINISDVLGNENKMQIEHIIPKSISLDDSFANKTLCDSKFNGLKGERTPYEFYQINNDANLWGGSKSWEEIERRTFRILPYSKAKRFTSKTKFETNDFIQRQLNDTRYISKKTKEILSQICEDVRVMPGSLTAELRKLWGLNNILHPAFVLDLPALHIDANKHIPHYVVLDEDNVPILSQRIYNDKPILKANQTSITGFVDNEIFKSKEKYVKFEVKAPNLSNGEYWAKLLLSNPKSIVRVFKEKPKSTENEIVVRGKIEKEKFKHEGLSGINAEGKENGTYWAKLSIVDKKFKKPKKDDQPKKNGKQILLFGAVKEGVFSSYMYECDADLEDGKYWLILDIDFENVEFEKALNERPEVLENQILIQGITNDENVFVSDMDCQHQFLMNEGKGKYYVLFDIISEVNEFYPIKTKSPELENGQSLTEGTIWVDKYTGEIKFDPKKNREDHRHHAIDALVIALTKETYFQQLSRRNASSENKKRGNEYEKEQLDFAEPWKEFHVDAQKSINSILISHKQNKNILTKITKKITKNGKTYKSEGMSVRGQLHDKTYYGHNKNCKADEYVYRVDINNLSFSQLTNIIDLNLKAVIVEGVIKKFEESEKLLFKKMNSKVQNLDKSKVKKIKAKVDKILKETSFFMPNEGKRYIRLNIIEPANFERMPVPIKKVRIRKVLRNAEKLNNEIKQFVDPQNNHHVLIYKDENGNLKEEVVTFWTVVERKRTGEPVYKLPSDGKKIVTTLQINDMFLLGLNEDEINWENPNYNHLKEHLYRVQKFTSGDFYFRIAKTSSIQNGEEKQQINSFGLGKNGWLTHNPIKVKISVSGKILKV
ncbi:CRISPR-associated endonuclease Csn1 [Halpernia humi]|uniref:CRISPR-associated endonuclease Cas9 n=1 Tax=Halpernia humi TaxID=493375 RepID=A0A1H6BLP7_9FLAO|nr:type II CRISPR RNA-guided endonuclease Cas9 [Halpernia humi]SEG61649.1 CRISPR-associated endonuclease Csn1 [Halpernia humi]